MQELRAQSQMPFAYIYSDKRVNSQVFSDTNKLKCEVHRIPGSPSESQRYVLISI